MRLGVLVIGAALVLATATGGRAGQVNCKQVNKYLQTGRSVKDVAETMVIDEDDVRKCQAQAGSEAPGGAPKSEAKPGEGKSGEAGGQGVGK